MECDETLPGGNKLNKQTINVAASISRKLLNLSRERGEDFQLVLTRYGLERFLYRLGRSKYFDSFVLKGAMLFEVWTKKTHRPTRDLDLLGYGENSGEHLKGLFQQLCQVEVEPDDGLEFDQASVRVEEIMENQEYRGQRVKLNASLERATIHLQIDISFGDVITPEAEVIKYPTLLEQLPAPRIQAYPRDTMVAEKLQAIVFFGMINSRMKDFYDLWIISRQFPFEGGLLVDAIKATFKRRGTSIPDGTPIGLSEEFASDKEKAILWKAFLNRTDMKDDSLDLAEMLDGLQVFLMPPLSAAKKSEVFAQKWQKGGPWVHE